MAQSRQSTGSETQRTGASSGKDSGQERGTPRKTSHDGPANTSGGKDVIAQAQDQAGAVVEQARQQATTQLSTQKERAVSTLGTLASALHEASRQVREQDDATMAGYIDSAASQVDRIVDTLNQQDLGQIIDSTGRFARRQPAVFLAAAIAVGFAGARFLRSSASSSSQDMRASGSSPYRDQPSTYGSDVGSGYAASSLGYGSAMGGNASEAGTGRDWQARSAFAAGPEGQ
jgi:hypothetical protein